MIICISWFVRAQSDILFMEEAACTSIACGAYLAHNELCSRALALLLVTPLHSTYQVARM